MCRYEDAGRLAAVPEKSVRPALLQVFNTEEAENYGAVPLGAGWFGTELSYNQ